MFDSILVVALISAVSGILMGGVDLLQQRQCSNYEEEMGTQTKYRHFDSCYLKTPSGFMPWAEFKARAMTKEQTK